MAFRLFSYRLHERLKKETVNLSLKYAILCLSLCLVHCYLTNHFCGDCLFFEYSDAIFKGRILQCRGRGPWGHNQPRHYRGAQKSTPDWLSIKQQVYFGGIHRYPVHRCKSFDFFIFVASALIIGADFVAPICTERSACSDIANGFRNRFIEDMHALAVSVVVHGSVTADTVPRSSFDGINVRADEQKLPSVLPFLPLDHLFDLLARVTMTCIFLSVGCDNKHRMFRHILGARVASRLRCRREQHLGKPFVRHLVRQGKRQTFRLRQPQRLNDGGSGARAALRNLCVVEPEAAQPQDLAVIGHGDDLLYWIHALACTHILPHNLRLFNLRDGGVQFDATALFNFSGRGVQIGATYSQAKRWIRYFLGS